MVANEFSSLGTCILYNSKQFYSYKESNSYMRLVSTVRMLRKSVITKFYSKFLAFLKGHTYFTTLQMIHEMLIQRQNQIQNILCSRMQIEKIDIIIAKFIAWFQKETTYQIPWFYSSLTIFDPFTAIYSCTINPTIISHGLCLMEFVPIQFIKFQKTKILRAGHEQLMISGV